MTTAAAPSSSGSHHAASSSIDDLYPDEEAQVTPAFPSLTPLSHDLDLLSPARAPTFSVDDFLLSRTKASDLNYILSDLRSYSEKLKDELYSIINQDYKDFVSLGSSLKAEAHRIARLGWSAPSMAEAAAGTADHVAQPGLMAPVRETLLASRSMLKSVQDDIQDCIKRREDATNHKARLELMLQLHDSIVRLEELLLIPNERSTKHRRRSSHASRRKSSLLSIGSLRERRGSLASIASGSDQALSDYAMSSDYAEESDSEDDAASDELHAGRVNGTHSRRKVLRRLSSDTLSLRSTVQGKAPVSSSSYARPGFETLSGANHTSSSSSASLLGLPQRIARTSAEYSRLRFLHRRIDEEQLTSFADALSDRIESIRSVLRNDLRALLAALLSPNSLLVHGRSSARLPSSPELRKTATSRPAATKTRRLSFLHSLSAKPHAGTSRENGEGPLNELDSWSQVAEPVEQDANAEAFYWEARLEEQRGWLEMAVTTLHGLRVEAREGEGVAKRRDEAEEAVRDLLVSKWVTQNIVDKPERKVEDNAFEMSFKTLPESVQAQFQEHRTYIQSLLLPPSSSTTLVELYNAILTFVGTTSYHVVEASLETATSAPSLTETFATANAADEKQEARCDIFTNVLWETIASQLLDTVGSTIFFVGQPDTFYTNFTLTNTFLQRLLSLAPSDEARTAVQAHPYWLAFKRRWQLPVYFQMRYREVITRLEADLADGRTKEGEGKWMKATSATLDAVEKLWSEGVHIHELSAREWRVTLQVISRYKTWIEEQSPAELGAGHRQLDALRIEGGPRSSFDTRPASSEISRVSTPQPAPDLSSQQHEDEQLQLGIDLLADCLRLRDRMESVLDDVILVKISSNIEDSEGLQGLRGDLWEVLDGEALDFVPGLAASVGRLTYNIIAPRAAAPLRLLRSYSTPAYRPSSTAPHSTGSASPSNPDANAAAAVQVIHSIFAPLTAFLSQPTTSTLPRPLLRDWTTRILGDTFKRYTSTIETINKNQQSLLRLKKSQTPTPGLLGSLFKSNPHPLDEQEAETDRAIKETSAHALRTFEHKLALLHLPIDLVHWDQWQALKAFLESQFDQL